MSTSLMYHGFGLTEQEYLKTEYKGGQIIFYVETKREHLRCSKCGSRHVKKKGYVYRDFRGVPIGLKPVIIRMKVQRLYCEECGITRQEEIRIADKKKVIPMDSEDMY